MNIYKVATPIFREQWAWGVYRQIRRLNRQKAVICFLAQTLDGKWYEYDHVGADEIDQEKQPYQRQETREDRPYRPRKTRKDHA